jgi:hypothetical protein
MWAICVRPTYGWVAIPKRNARRSAFRISSGKVTRGCLEVRHSDRTQLGRCAEHCPMTGVGLVGPGADRLLWSKLDREAAVHTI